MRRLAAFIFTLLIAVTSLAGDVALIEPGEFHGSDIEPIHLSSEELWLGFYPRGDDYIWKKVVVTVEVTRDEMVDEEGQATGRTVAAMSAAVPLFLVRGLDELGAQQITTLRRDVSLGNGSVEKLSLNGAEYRIEVSNPGPVGKVIKDGSVLTLVTGAAKQQLFEIPNGANDPDWQLIWAGDLDGDGKLDLYMDLSDHYNVSHRRLFLSSRARPGSLVQEVADFRTVGC